jgi:hypothetical protein
MASRQEIVSYLRIFNITPDPDFNESKPADSDYYETPDYITEKEFLAFLSMAIRIPETLPQLFKLLSQEVPSTKEEDLETKIGFTNQLVTTIRNWTLEPHFTLQSKIFQAYTKFARSIRLDIEATFQAFKHLFNTLQDLLEAKLLEEVSLFREHEDYEDYLKHIESIPKVTQNWNSEIKLEDDQISNTFSSSYSNLIEELALHQPNSEAIQILLTFEIDSTIILKHRVFGLGLPIRIIPLQMIMTTSDILNKRFNINNIDGLDPQPVGIQHVLKSFFKKAATDLSTLQDGTKTSGDPKYMR